MAPGVDERLLDDAQQLHAHLPRKLPGEPRLDEEGGLAAGRHLPVQADQRLDRPDERPLLLVPEVVHRAAQARGGPREGLELLF
jgi:hypothetical protein